MARARLKRLKRKTLGYKKMKKIILLALIALVLSNLLVGCVQEKPEEKAGETEITADIADIEELDSDLDISELESLDQEFADLEELFSET